MSIGDARCKDLCPGQRVSLTGRIASGGSQRFQALWHDEVFHLEALVLEAGVWTLYDFQYMGIRDGNPVLAKCEGSQHYACGSISLDSYRKIVELCSGMGGLAAGITRLGGLPVLQVDKTALACEVVALNGGNALQGDVCRPEVQMQIHAQVEGQACLFATGFPCQPFSCQCSRLGFADARGVVLHFILTTVWRTQSAGLILECVADVMDFPEVSQLLHAFADHANFQYSEVCLELADQWVSRRRRWWATLLPKSSHLFYLVEWPRLNPRPVISNVMPELPLWAEHEERQLAWTDEETAKMLNPAYGTDARFLSMHDTAPTALHSWGSALGPCPCGCRSQGFSEARLQSGGLRGVGVQSAALQRPRFLHPAEAGLLNSLPLTFKLPADMRAGLCLVGLLSAPLQSMWIYSQVLHWAETGLSGWPRLGEALQAIYFDIAAQDQRSSRISHTLEELPDMERMLPPGLGTPRRVFMEELLPIAWRQLLSMGRSQFPVEFKRDVVQFLLKQDSSSELAQPITWLELVVMMVLDGAVCFPVQGQRDRWVAHFEATFRQSLTLTVQLRLFRRAAIEVLRSFGLQSLLREHLSLAPLGFALSLDGLVIGADSGLRFKARESLVHFAGGRTISTAAGLSRPLAAR